MVEELLVEGLSYERMCGKYWVIMSKTDFYRYRMKAIYLISEKFAENNIRIVEQWFLSNYIRRYLSLSNAQKELGCGLSTVKEIAVKAGALVMIGKLHRGDMKKL